MSITLHNDVNSDDAEYGKRFHNICTRKTAAWTATILTMNQCGSTQPRHRAFAMCFLSIQALFVTVSQSFAPLQGWIFDNAFKNVNINSGASGGSFNYYFYQVLDEDVIQSITGGRHSTLYEFYLCPATFIAGKHRLAANFEGSPHSIGR